jgi:hypothetical protein
MAFEIVEPGLFTPPPPLQEGQASLSKSGKLTVRERDLAMIGVTTAAVALADRELLRLALRAPRDGEKGKTVAVSIVGSGKAKKDTGRRQVNMIRAIRRLDLLPAATCGRYELTTKGSAPGEALLIVGLCDAPASGKGKKTT